MKRGLFELVLSVLPTLIAATENSLREDPLGHDPKLEVVHLYKGQYPSAIAVSASGRMFSCYPAGIDMNNVNDGENGAYQVAELTDFDTESPYPNVEYNSPPGGAIDNAQNPPVTKGLTNYLLAVQSVVVDFEDTLWIVDTGRVVFNGTQLLASPGGTKLVSVNLTTDTVTRTYTFPTTVAKPNSYFDDVRFDLRRQYAYISDISDAMQDNAIVVVDLATGQSWRTLVRDRSVIGIFGTVPFIYGDPLYQIRVVAGQAVAAEFLSYGVDGIALSPDLGILYYSVAAGRYLYSVPTELLRNKTTPMSEVAFAVRNLGEKGISDGLATDSTGVVYAGNAEQSGVSMYDPVTRTTVLFVRDKRINWVDTFSVAEDGYLYFTVTQFNFIQSNYAGQGPLGEDRRRKPYVLFRARLPANATKGPGS